MSCDVISIMKSCEKQLTKLTTFSICNIEWRKICIFAKINFIEKRAIIIAATSGIGKQLAINLLQDAW